MAGWIVGYVILYWLGTRIRARYGARSLWILVPASVNTERPSSFFERLEGLFGRLEVYLEGWKVYLEGWKVYLAYLAALYIGLGAGWMDGWRLVYLAYLAALYIGLVAGWLVGWLEASGVVHWLGGWLAG